MSVGGLSQRDLSIDAIQLRQVGYLLTLAADNDYDLLITLPFASLRVFIGTKVSRIISSKH